MTNINSQPIYFVKHTTFYQNDTYIIVEDDWLWNLKLVETGQIIDRDLFRHDLAERNNLHIEYRD